MKANGIKCTKIPHIVLECWKYIERKIYPPPIHPNLPFKMVEFWPLVHTIKAIFTIVSEEFLGFGIFQPEIFWDCDFLSIVSKLLVGNTKYKNTNTQI